MTEQTVDPHVSVCFCVFLCVQTLQDKVCEFQARLRSEEVTRHVLLQQLQQQSVQEKTSVRGVQTSASPNGEVQLHQVLM